MSDDEPTTSSPIRTSRPKVTLTDISSRAWEHPADKGALTALRQLKGFDIVLRKLAGLGCASCSATSSATSDPATPSTPRCCGAVKDKVGTWFGRAAATDDAADPDPA